MTWSPQQDAALKAVADWLRRGETPLFRLFGYAGTGKTTLARNIAEGVDGDVAFGAYTGKAALVLRSKGCADASTIHSMIYRSRESDENGPQFVLNRQSPASKADLIVIDECSMVDEELGRDLLSFGQPVLVLGDPAQLPPVKGGGFFTEGEPDVMLTEVHRQAKDNPIIHLSMMVREGGRLATGSYGLAWLVRPGVLILFGLVVVGLLVPIVRGLKDRRTRAGSAPLPARTGFTVDGRIAVSMAMVLLFAWALWQSLGYGLRAGLFPWAVTVPALGLAIVQLARDLSGRRDVADRSASATGAGVRPADPPPDVHRRTAEIGAWILGMFAAIWLMGFALATFVTTLLYLKVGARERWAVSIALSVGGFLFVHGLFERVLAVPFPPGQLLAWLGYD